MFEETVWPVRRDSQWNPIDPNGTGLLPVGLKRRKERLPGTNVDIVSILADNYNPQGAVEKQKSIFYKMYSILYRRELQELFLKHWWLTHAKELIPSHQFSDEPWRWIVPLCPLEMLTYKECKAKVCVLHWDNSRVNCCMNKWKRRCKPKLLLLELLKE